MRRKITFEINHADEIPSEDPNFAIARVHAFSSGENRHEMECDIETLQRTAPTIYEKPVVFDYDRNLGDFRGHSSEPFIAGFIVPDSAEFIELDDGRTGLTVIAKIWKRYSRKFMDVFSLDNSDERKVSVEMELFDFEENEENGLLKMLDFAYTAVAVLGKFVSEASPDAHLKILSFTQQEDKEKYFSRYGSIDFSIPDDVKKNAQNGLELRSKHGRGGTSVGVSHARYLVKNKKISPQKARHMAKYFPRHEGEDFEDKTSNGWIAWQLWGGNAGRSWSEKIVEQLNSADKKRSSLYMAEDGEDKLLEEKEKKENMTLMEKENDLNLEEEKTPETQEVDMQEDVQMEEDKEEKKEDVEMQEEPDEEESEEFEEGTEEEDSEDVQMEEEVEDEDVEEDEEEEAHMALGEFEKFKEMYGKFSLDLSIEEASEEKISPNIAKIITAMFSLYETLESQVTELREFKEKVISERFSFEVETTIADVSQHLSADQIAEVKEKSKEFTLETIDGWKNMVKALAFSNTNGEKAEKKPYNKFALPFDETKKDNGKNTLWK